MNYMNKCPGVPAWSKENKSHNVQATQDKAQKTSRFLKRGIAATCREILRNHLLGGGDECESRRECLARRNIVMDFILAYHLII